MDGGEDGEEMAKLFSYNSKCNVILPVIGGAIV